MDSNTRAEKIKSIKGIFTQPPKQVPSPKVVDGPILGNGDVGVVLSGPPEHQRYYISKNDFWKSKAHEPNGGPRSIGGLDFVFPDLNDAEYYGEQAIYEAEARSIFRKGALELSLRSWVAATENTLFIEITCLGKAISVEMALWMQPGDESHTVLGQEGELKWGIRSYLNDDLAWPTEAIIAAKCLSGSGSRLRVESGKTVIVAVTVGTNHDEVDFIAQTKTRCTLLEPASLADIRSAHEQWWMSFWDKSYIDIGDETLEKFWYGSHYIMASCSRNRHFPPGLFGNWITTDEPAWQGDYHLNYNYQAAWWGAYSSNHIELCEPYETPIMEFIPEGRRNATGFLNNRGVYYEVGIGPKGFSTTQTILPYEGGKLFLGQKSNAAYCAVNMLMRFYHTYNLDYARNIAYPFLREVADFWMDYVQLEGDRYVIRNDAIHEVESYTDIHSDDHWMEGFKDKNPILSLALVRLVLQGVLNISRELDVDADLRDSWEHVWANLASFPVYERNGKTIFRLTEVGMDWSDGNTLAIQLIWPAGAMGLSSDPELLTIARNTIDELDRWTDYNGFSSIFTAAARVGYDPQLLLNKLREQCEQHSFPNLFIFFGGGGIETCSGVTSAINEMLLQSHEEQIVLFPAWPSDQDASFVDLRAYGAFLVSAQLKEKVVDNVTIKSDRGRTCSIVNPWQNKLPVIYNMDGTSQTVISYELKGQTVVFETSAGATYRMEGN